MKTIWKRFGRRIVVSGVLMAMGIAGTIPAQELLSALDRGSAETSSVSSSMQQIPVTPELAADVLLAHHDYAKAIQAFQKIQPQTAYTYNKIGIAYQWLSMDAEAKMNFHDAAWLEDEAKFYYRKALNVDPKYAPAYNNLGTVSYHANDNKAARHYYRKAIKLDPKAASYWSNIGAVYLSKKDFRTGAEAYQRAFALNPNIFEQIAMDGIQHHESARDLAAMYLCFAEVYARAGMKTEAVEYLRKAFMEGLPDKQKVAQDVQLASLRGTPEFEQLFANYQTK
jgi:tetratricopeptide (TPR) repeat protein